MNSNYEAGYAHLMKTAGLEKTAISTKLLKRLLDLEYPNAPVSADRLQWGRRTGDWDGVTDDMVRWAQDQDTKFAPAAPDPGRARRELASKWDLVTEERTRKRNEDRYMWGQRNRWSGVPYEKEFNPTSSLAYDTIREATDPAGWGSGDFMSTLSGGDDVPGEVLLNLLKNRPGELPIEWVGDVTLDRSVLADMAAGIRARDVMDTPSRIDLITKLRAMRDSGGANARDVVQLLSERGVAPGRYLPSSAYSVPETLPNAKAVASMPAELMADYYSSPPAPATNTKVLDSIRRNIYEPSFISEQVRRDASKALNEESSASRAKLEALQRSRVNAEVPKSVRPELSTLDFDSGSLVDNPTMFDPKRRAYRGQSAYKRVPSLDPTWVSGHPDLAYQYSSNHGASPTNRVFEFDPSKIPKKEQSPWHGHLAKDTRGMSRKQVSTLPAFNANPIGTSPYYEKVVTEGALRPTLTRRWRPTKDGGLELMEDFAKSKGKKPEF